MSFKNDALERIFWSTVEGACTGAVAGWGASVLTSVSDLQAFALGVAVPAGTALFTSIKVYAAKRLGKDETAALPLGSPYTQPH